MVARSLFNNVVSSVDHFPLVRAGAADEPHSSHAHDIWRAQDVCLVPTTHHPPYMDWICGPVICGLQKYSRLLHIRGLGKREGMLPLSNGNACDATGYWRRLSNSLAPIRPQARPCYSCRYYCGGAQAGTGHVCMFSDYVYVVDD
ncbi:hypothetical protein FJTKL_11337 [Diaporthe vaccinii]|uniref:Uncharacterized protein n=1 Tax=Diaporthe vaccinii TaxID=105482 RepID=A0ABR4EHF6_9PEZI